VNTNDNKIDLAVVTEAVSGFTKALLNFRDAVVNVAIPALKRLDWVNQEVEKQRRKDRYLLRYRRHGERMKYRKGN
jgi:predicted transcriptional regulator